MHLIIGLGNPGEKYKHSRHNVGFILTDSFAGNFEYDKYVDAEITKKDNILVVKPQTFMNNSGVAVASLAKKYFIVSENIIVIHDDIDLPFGTWRIQYGRGAGGHNGVQSVIDQIGTNEFIRIKVGIAPMDDGGKAIKPKPGIFQTQKGAVSRYVLKDFSKADQEKLKAVAPQIQEAIETLIKDGREKAMNKFN